MCITAATAVAGDNSSLARLWRIPPGAQTVVLPLRDRCSSERTDITDPGARHYTPLSPANPRHDLRNSDVIRLENIFLARGSRRRQRHFLPGERVTFNGWSDLPGFELYQHPKLHSAACQPRTSDGQLQYAPANGLLRLRTNSYQCSWDGMPRENVTMVCTLDPRRPHLGGARLGQGHRRHEHFRECVYTAVTVMRQRVNPLSARSWRIFPGRRDHFDPLRQRSDARRPAQSDSGARLFTDTTTNTTAPTYSDTSTIHDDQQWVVDHRL